MDFGTALKPRKVTFASREAWLQERTGIGSSEIATVVGLNPYETRFQLWQKKKGLVGPTPDNPAMKSGRFLEDAVGKFFEDATGREIIKASAEDIMYIHPEKDFLRVTPDRRYWLGGTKNEENKAVLECKTTQMQIDENDIPKWWFCQLQDQLGIMQSEHGSLAWLSGGRNFGFVDLDFVPDFFGWMVEEAEKFWVDHILANVMPELVNVADVVARYGKHTEGKIIEISPAMFESYEALKTAKDELKAKDVEVTELEDELKMCFKDAEALTYQGRTIATWRTSKDSEKFDAKAFAEFDLVTYNKFLKNVAGSRRFLLK